MLQTDLTIGPQAYSAVATIADLNTPTPFALPSSSVPSQQQQQQPLHPQRLNFSNAGGPRSIGRPGSSAGFGFGGIGVGANESAHTATGHGRSVLPLTPVSMSPPSDVDDNSVSSPHFGVFGGGGSGGGGNAGAFRSIVGQPRIGQMANANQSDENDDANGSGSGSVDALSQNDMSSRLLSS